MPPTDDLIGTPSLLILAAMALLTFATAAKWVRAPRSLVLAAVAASVTFAAHNSHIGRVAYGEYWGTFPSVRLTSAELLVLYATQALVFVGASGTVLARLSRRAPWLGVPFVWLVGWFVVVMSVYEMSQALSDLFHWPWVASQNGGAMKFWGGRLAMAYLFIALVGRERKATPEVTTTPVVERTLWQRLQFAPTLVVLVAIMGATLYLSAERADHRKAEGEAARLDFAKRLRADGDRLASEGQWEDALARYDQAEPYDRNGELESETQQKLQAMREHVGRVVFDKKFDDRGTPP